MKRRKFSRVYAEVCTCCLFAAVNADPCECPEGGHPKDLMSDLTGDWSYMDDLGFRLFHVCDGCGSRLGGDRYELIQLIERNA